MIYRPIETRRLWDTWLFPWENRYHLFHLETQQTNCDYIGHAVSKDLVHWETLDSFHSKGSAGQWNDTATLTGTTVYHDGQFYMFIGAYSGGVETVGVYTSTDLEHWQAHPDNPVLRPAGPHYCTASSPYIWPVDWRDPDITWHEDDGHYHATLCGRLPQWSHEDTGAVIAHVRSKDLVHWTHLPPIATPGKHFFHTELPNIFEVDGKYYLAFNTCSLGGIKINTPSREQAIGSFYMVADKFDGPYALPSDPLLIGSGFGRRDACCARTIQYQGGRLLYHHTAADRPAWGAPKIVKTNSDRAIELKYSPILEKLESRVLIDSTDKIPVNKLSDLGIWQHKNGKIIGTANAVGSSYLVTRDVADFHFECTISAESNVRAGVVIRALRGEKGIAILLDFEKQRAQICFASGETFDMKSYDPNFGWTTIVRDSTPFQFSKGRPYHLRCFARNEFIEVYIENRWVFTTVMEQSPRRGDINLCIECGKAEFENIRLAEIETLP